MIGGFLFASEKIFTKKSKKCLHVTEKHLHLLNNKQSKAMQTIENNIVTRYEAVKSEINDIEIIRKSNFRYLASYESNFKPALTAAVKDQEAVLVARLKVLYPRFYALKALQPKPTPEPARVIMYNWKPQEIKAVIGFNSDPRFAICN